MNEIDQVREKFERGDLDHIGEDLESFIRTHHADILRFKEEYNARGPRQPLDDALAIKFYILRVRSINPKREIQEQLREIEKETWIQGERLGRAPDPHEVAMHWARLYSPGWRAHRVTAIIYVFERLRDRLAGLLRKCPE